MMSHSHDSVDQKTLMRGMLLGLGGFALFTCGDALVKYSASHYHVFQVGMTSAFTAMVLLLIFSKWLGGVKATFITPKWKLMWARGVILGIQSVCGVYAFANLPFTKAYTLIFVAPFVTALLGIFVLGDKVGWRRWATIATGFCGVLIVLRPGVIPLELGAIAAMTTGCLAAVSWILVRKIGDGQTLMSFSMYPSIVGFSIMAVLGASHFVVPGAVDLMLMCGIAVFGVSGMLMVSTAFQIAPPVAVSPFHYSQIIFGVLWGYLFFNEVPDSWTFGGSAVIIASGLYIVYREHVRKKDVVSDFEPARPEQA